jgi:membrane protease YdiL (CAAX protease family)
MLAALLVTVPGLLVGAAHFVPNPEAPLDFGSMFFVAVVLLFGAIGEELLFHGYGFQVLVRALGPFATILPTGFLFALAHSSNQNFGGFLGWPLLNTGLWGVVLGYAVVRAGDLWLPIGLHFGWNVVLPFFGVNLSGFKMGVTGYALKWTAGDLWSGGEYGPEASVLTTVVTILLIVYLAKAPVMRQTTALLGPPDDDPEAPADDLVQS